MPENIIQDQPYLIVILKCFSNTLEDFCLLCAVHFQICQTVTIIERRMLDKRSSFLVIRNYLKMLTGCTLTICSLQKNSFTWVIMDLWLLDVTDHLQCWTEIIHTLWWYPMLQSMILGITDVMKTTDWETDTSSVSLSKVFLLFRKMLVVGRKYFLFTLWPLKIKFTVIESVGPMVLLNMCSG